MAADPIFFICLSVGVEAADERIEALLSELKGKDINEVIAAGREKYASVPGGGGGGGAVAVGAGGGGGAPAAAAPAAEVSTGTSSRSWQSLHADVG